TVTPLREICEPVPLVMLNATRTAGPLTSPTPVPVAVVDVIDVMRAVTVSPKSAEASFGTVCATGAPKRGSAVASGAGVVEVAVACGIGVSDALGVGLDVVAARC